MLLFIKQAEQNVDIHTCFNTSHVVIYPCYAVGENDLSLSFNTSHVVIYPTRLDSYMSAVKRFNTSHVVIYQTSRAECGYTHLFQYISCCYLSVVVTWAIQQEISVSIHLMLLFINENN